MADLEGGAVVYLVDLFSGTHSVSQALDSLGLKNMRVFSVDIDPRSRPTVATDISAWNFAKDLGAFLVDRRPQDIVIVHASPPCTQYSVAKTQGVRDLLLADSLASRALRIINWVNPTLWSIENPRGLLRERPFMQPLHRYLHPCSYCRSGFPYRKNTDIWTNCETELLRCSSATPCPSQRIFQRHLSSAQHGYKVGRTEVTGTHRKNAYRLPEALVHEIYATSLRRLGALHT